MLSQRAQAPTVPTHRNVPDVHEEPGRSFQAHNHITLWRLAPLNGFPAYLEVKSRGFLFLGKIGEAPVST